MPGPLWTPSPERIARANLTALRTGTARTPTLYEWSVTRAARVLARDVGVRRRHRGDMGARVAIDLDRMPGARFFPDATLNFAENVLGREGSGPAIIFKAESGTPRTMSWRELRAESAAFAAALRAAGIRPGDRVAAYLANVPEAIVAVLGAASIGAVWSSLLARLRRAGRPRSLRPDRAADPHRRRQLRLRRQDVRPAAEDRGGR